MFNIYCQYLILTARFSSFYEKLEVNLPVALVLKLLRQKIVARASKWSSCNDNHPRCHREYNSGYHRIIALK